MLFGLQSVINMAVNLDLMPAKGMTLPFISYGGSSMIAVAFGMGLLLALTRRRPSRASVGDDARRAEPRAGRGLSGDADGGLVLLSAGGTGGHLFPAEALAQALAGAAGAFILRPTTASSAYGRNFPAEEVHVIRLGDA